MEELQLGEALQRHFSERFACCERDGLAAATGPTANKVPLETALDLLASAVDVPRDALAQIGELCWGDGAEHLSRRQFYAALKLVAAYQSGVPVRADTVTAPLDLPPPRFAAVCRPESSCSELEDDDTATACPDLIELHNDRYGEFGERLDSDCESSDLNGTLRTASPEVSSTASDSPTPTNSVQDKGWAVAATWHGLVSEERRQLLGTEEESSDRHSSEDDTEVSNQVWIINAEQRDYYTNQFRSLQPDTNALLAGPIARMFFEKSRLPVQELRKIWQLADVTRDGALSLQEFLIAMHLVVLRRNHIELPDVLPPQLMPGNETPHSASPATEPILSPQVKDTAKEWTKFVESPTGSVSSPGPKPVNFDFQKGAVEKDPKILHPVPLRLTPECGSGTTSAHLDDQVDAALSRGFSPQKFVDLASQNNSSSTVAQNLPSAPSTSSNDIKGIQRPQPKKINIPGPGAIPPPPVSSQACASEEGPLSLPTAYPPPKKEKPPPPPPRPFKSHGRSSSLDLNKLNKCYLGAPPSVPPRASPGTQASAMAKAQTQTLEGEDETATLSPFTGPTVQFANFEQFEQSTKEKYENVLEGGIFPGDVYEAERKKLFSQFLAQENVATTISAAPLSEVPQRHGAFEVYRKPKSQGSPPINIDQAKWELFYKLQEENTVLLRLCQELSQELADVREERMTLKVRLEQQQQMKQNGG